MNDKRKKAELKWKPPLTRNETVLFFRMGYFNYVKVNYEINDHLEVQQVNKKWYKFDFLFDWKLNQTDFFIDGKYEWTTPFHHGKDKYAVGQGLTPSYTGVDSLILYTLSPEGVSEFMDLKLCKKRCKEETSLKNALKLGASAKILMATLLIYLSLMSFD